MFTRQLLVLFTLSICVLNTSAGAENKIIYTIYKNERRNFDEARKYCKEKLPHGTLATVTKAEDQQYLEERIIREGLWDSPLWIGGKYSPKDKEIKWVDSHARYITYVKWDKENKREEIDQCLLVNKKARTFRWATSSCRDKHLFICQHFE